MKSTFNKRQYWARLVIMTILSLVLTFAVMLIWVSYRQTQNYLHPLRYTASEDMLRANNIEFQDIELLTEDKVKLSAWYTPSQNRAVVLLAHGYGDKRMEDIYVLFASHGYGVVAWDFRAHGESEGDYSTLGYYEVLDAKAALDFALAQPDVEHVGAWGGSMGAVTMIRATAQYPEIEALVADSPFATLEEQMDFRVPFPLMRPLIRFFAKNEASISLDMVRPLDDIVRISPRPIFIIQGMGDRMVSLDSAQRLYDAAGEPRELWLEDGVPHLGMFADDGGKYTERIIGFFDEYLLGK